MQLNSSSLWHSLYPSLFFSLSLSLSLSFSLSLSRLLPCMCACATVRVCKACMREYVCLRAPMSVYAFLPMPPDLPKLCASISLSLSLSLSLCVCVCVFSIEPKQRANNRQTVYEPEI